MYIHKPYTHIMNKYYNLFHKKIKEDLLKFLVFPQKIFQNKNFSISSFHPHSFLQIYSNPSHYSNRKIIHPIHNYTNNSIKYILHSKNPISRRKKLLNDNEKTISFFRNLNFIIISVTQSVNTLEKIKKNDRYIQRQIKYIAVIFLHLYKKKKNKCKEYKNEIK